MRQRRLVPNHTLTSFGEHRIGEGRECGSTARPIQQGGQGGSVESERRMDHWRINRDGDHSRADALAFWPCLGRRNWDGCPLRGSCCARTPDGVLIPATDNAETMKIDISNTASVRRYCAVRERDHSVGKMNMESRHG